MHILSRRRAESAPAAAAVPAPEPQQPRVGFEVTVRSSIEGPGVLAASAITKAREWFGPGWDLKITDPWTASKPNWLYEATIIVWAVPEAVSAAREDQAA